MKRVKNILLAAMSFIPLSVGAQFYVEDGVEVKECDCANQLNNLDVVITLPENYKKYDIIQYVMYKDGSAMQTFYVYVRNMESGTRKFSILNNENKGLRTFFGREYGLYHGNDFQNVSYNNICEGSSAVRMQMKVLGISQVDTEYYTDYDFSNSGKVTSHTRAVPVYDKGVEIAKTDELVIKQDGFMELIKTKESGNTGALIVGGAVVLGYIAFLVIGTFGA